MATWGDLVEKGRELREDLLRGDRDAESFDDREQLLFLISRGRFTRDKLSDAHIDTLGLDRPWPSRVGRAVRGGALGIPSVPSLAQKGLQIGATIPTGPLDRWMQDVQRGMYEAPRTAPSTAQAIGR